ncbi:MAG: ABC transporter ATP-binding protein [Elusimicrobia bacterium]|nr:ABC transporter ATP-binding protein [Elusimicrobiota bacterium]
MSSEPVIRVQGVSKCFQLYRKPIHRLLQMFAPGSLMHEDFWALRDVHFQVSPGETVGIMGRNGAGKSTLLQVITGTLTPTEGMVQVAGRLSAMLELGSGFNPEFTGLENIHLNGAVLGLSRSEMDSRLDEILAFADIGDFVRHPIKTYSSGMLMRLAFSVAVHTNPRILIIDEALSVGDIRFQNKCLRRLNEFRDSGCSILLVSHSPGLMEAFCDRVIWLEGGRIKAIGSPSGLVRDYVNFMAHDLSREAMGKPMGPSVVERGSVSKTTDWRPITSSHNIRDRGKAHFEAFRISIAGTPFPSQVDSSRTTFELEVSIRFAQPVLNPLVAVGVTNDLNEPVFHINSYNLEKTDFAVESPGRARWRVVFEMPALRPGSYLIALGIDDGFPGQSEILCHVYDVWSFRVPAPANPALHQGGYIQIRDANMSLIFEGSHVDVAPS